MAPSAVVILLIEGARPASSLAPTLEGRGFHVVRASNSKEALSRVRTDAPALAVVNSTSLHTDGKRLCLDLARRLQLRQQQAQEGGHPVGRRRKLHSVKELARFREKQPEYRLVEDLGKVIAFQKLTDAPLLEDFGSQPYIMERTEAYSRNANPYAR